MDVVILVLNMSKKCIKVERNKFVSKSAEKLLKYRIMFKDILTFLGLDYRDASLITSLFP